MGGRHFNLITKSEWPLEGSTLDDLRESLSGRILMIGRKSDRYRNFLTAFEIDERYVETHNIRIVDTSEPSLALLEAVPNAIIAGGQNVRFLAQLAGGYVENLDYNLLSDSARKAIHESAGNCLVVGKKWEKAAIADDWLNKLINKFYGVASDSRALNILVKSLVDHCAFEDNLNADDREKITRHVLFETYRMGQPQCW